MSNWVRRWNILLYLSCYGPVIVKRLMDKLEGRIVQFVKISHICHSAFLLRADEALMAVITSHRGSGHSQNMLLI